MVRFLNICGLTKLTLLDYPGEIACTVFTGGCNLRCPFCHNASLVTGLQGNTHISEADFFAFLNKRRNMLDGVCITGGEPLLQPALMVFLKSIKELGYLIKLDTNGCFPERLKEVLSKGLINYVAMDIKSSPEQYARATGIENLDFSPIEESIDFLLTGTVEYEFRTTVVRELHNAEILSDAARTIRGAEHYYLQKFVDSGGLIGSSMSSVSNEEMKAFLDVVSPYVKNAALRGV